MSLPTELSVGPAAKLWKLYLDACCLSRLSDDQSQPRLRAEAESIEQIMRLIREGLAIWVSSTVLSLEVSRNPDQDRRRDTETLLWFANEIAVPGAAEAERARHLEEFGFSAFDALHLAIAEQAAVDVFLTTDEGILRRARRNLSLLRVRVENPVSWYTELKYASHR